MRQGVHAPNVDPDAGGWPCGQAHGFVGPLRDILTALVVAGSRTAHLVPTSEPDDKSVVRSSPEVTPTGPVLVRKPATRSRGWAEGAGPRRRVRVRPTSSGPSSGRQPRRRARPFRCTWPGLGMIQAQPRSRPASITAMVKMRTAPVVDGRFMRHPLLPLVSSSLHRGRAGRTPCPSPIPAAISVTYGSPRLRSAARTASSGVSPTPTSRESSPSRRSPCSARHARRR